MPKINDGGPAFPMPSGAEPRVDQTTHYNEGMTLRQWYAGQALSGIVASYSGMAIRESVELVSKVGGPEAFADCVAKAAVIYADAVLRALETPP